MFGQNKTAPLAHVNQSGEELEVHSIFATIQGEGPHAGEPAIFVRLAGCNLKCLFCDTAFERATLTTVKNIVSEVRRLNQYHTTSLVVLTGGEPMRQQIIPLIAALDGAGYHIQIETAGTTWPLDVGGIALVEAIMSGAVDIVCSPKTKKIHPMVMDHCYHFKYIIRKNEVSAIDGLPIMSTQIKDRKAEIYRPHQDDAARTIWVQPCAEYHDTPYLGKAVNVERTEENVTECLRVAMIYGYRLSIQLHKLPGIRDIVE